jgi:hypothetical protein
MRGFDRLPRGSWVVVLAFGWGSTVHRTLGCLRFGRNKHVLSAEGCPGVFHLTSPLPTLFGSEGSVWHSAAMIVFIG